MKEQILGLVTEAERDEVKRLHSRRTGLHEIITTLASSGLTPENNFYERLVADVSDVNAQFGDWWRKVSTKYGWPNDSRLNWNLDFETRQIKVSSR